MRELRAARESRFCLHDGKIEISLTFDESFKLKLDSCDSRD